MPVGKAHAFASELIDVRGWNLAPHRVVAPDVAISEIVGIDEDDVGRGEGSFGRGKEGRGFSAS